MRAVIFSVQSDSDDPFVDERAAAQKSRLARVRICGVRGSGADRGPGLTLSRTEAARRIVDSACQLPTSCTLIGRPSRLVPNRIELRQRSALPGRASRPAPRQYQLRGCGNGSLQRHHRAIPAAQHLCREAGDGHACLRGGWRIRPDHGPLGEVAGGLHHRALCRGRRARRWRRLPAVMRSSCGAPASCRRRSQGSRTRKRPTWYTMASASSHSPRRSTVSARVE